MTIHTLDSFAKKNLQSEDAVECFQLESEYMLKIDLEGHAWVKKGAMVAYTGHVHFKREGIIAQGLRRLFAKVISGEGAKLNHAYGDGELFLADQGKMVSILYLENQAIYVNGNDILAFEDSIDWDIKMIKSLTGMIAGGMFNIRLSGTGFVALTTHHNPLVLAVARNRPVITDPNNTVAWSGNLTPHLKVDLSLSHLIGRASGETVQMRFEGDGFVVVQPYEEASFQRKFKKRKHENI